jgi:hypothetical protein
MRLAAASGHAQDLLQTIDGIHQDVIRLLHHGRARQPEAGFVLPATTRWPCISIIPELIRMPEPKRLRGMQPRQLEQMIGYTKPHCVACVHHGTCCGRWASEHSYESLNLETFAGE